MTKEPPSNPSPGPSAVTAAGGPGVPAHRRRAFRSKPKAMPLRTWLMILLVIISGLGMGASSLAVSTVMRDVFYNRVDKELYEALGGWAQSSDLFEADVTKRPPTDFAVLNYYPDGSLRWFNINEATPAVDNVVIGAAPSTIGSIPTSPVDSQWRVLAVEDNGVVTVVAKRLDDDQATLRGLVMLQIIISSVVLAVIAAVGYWLIKLSLRPLRVVEQTASAIAGGDYDRRVPEWPLHTEVGRLASALNIMLTRLQKSIEQAQSQEEQMRRFVGDASHELRTPLTSLRGYTELYRSGATDDAGFVFGKVDAESKRMSLLVEDLLALTRAEGSRLDMTKVDLLELTMSVASSARAAFPDRVVDVTPKTKGIPLVNGDADRLHQVFLNLVSNGLRHGGPEAKVCITLRDEAFEGADGVVVEVADDGKGMSAEVASHVFERFYRSDASRTRDTGGSGLGLAIAKSLVELHGGEISVESTEGEGSVFTVRLPAYDETSHGRD